MTHQFSFPGDADTMLDLFATVIDILDGCCNDAHVVVSVDAARDSEAKQVEATETVLTGNGIAVGENITDFTSADTCLLYTSPSPRD